jgi:putative endonuclease
MYYFYLLKSSKTSRLYKGQCQDLSARLKQHNSGKTKSTRCGIPWKLLYLEQFETRAEAVQKERYYKSLRGSKELCQKIEFSGSPARAGTSSNS